VQKIYSNDPGKEIQHIAREAGVAIFKVDNKY
jgi:hypothetical protein